MVDFIQQGSAPFGFPIVLVHNLVLVLELIALVIFAVIYALDDIVDGLCLLLEYLLSPLLSVYAGILLITLRIIVLDFLLLGWRFGLIKLFEQLGVFLHV